MSEQVAELTSVTSRTESALARRRAIWHFVSPEFPPQVGGVGDYMFLLSKSLAESGHEVHVWCPRGESPAISPPGVDVRTELGQFGLAGLWRVGRALNRFPRPRRIVLQWVPHGFGWRSMNIALCLWIWTRSRLRGDDLGIMVHEPFLSFRRDRWRQSGAALVHRLMTIILMHAAQRVWVSTPRWQRALKPYTFGRRIPFDWLPVPSNVPVVNDGRAIRALRARYASRGEPIVGHFGTFGESVTSMLNPIVARLLEQRPDAVLLLIGSGSDEFRNRMLCDFPQFQGRLHATGRVSGHELSTHISACDLMIQPFPDGASSRRSSLMAALAHAVPVVTTSGASTEPFWLATEGINIVSSAELDGVVSQCCRLLSDDEARRRCVSAESSLYENHFAIERIARVLESSYSDAVHAGGPGGGPCES